MKAPLRLRRLASIIVPAMIVLLAARLGGLPMDANGPSPARQFAELVTCILSVDPGEGRSLTSSAPARDTDEFDCDATHADPFRAAWISAC